MKTLSRIFSSATLALLSAGSAMAYTVGNEDRSGNMTTFSDVSMKQTDKAPEISIGKAIVTGLAEGDREGFISADELNLENLKLAYEGDKLSVLVTVPQLRMEHYRGPAFSEKQLEESTYAYPFWQWARLLSQVYSDAYNLPDGLSIEIKTRESSGQEAVFTYNLKSGSGTLSGDTFSEEITQGTVGFQLTTESGERVDYSVIIDDYNVELKGAVFEFIDSFYYPESHESSGPLAISSNTRKITFHSKVVASGDETTQSSEISNYSVKNFTLPAFDREQRQVISALISDFAHRDMMKQGGDTLFAGLDSQALVKVVTNFIENATFDSISVDSQKMESIASIGNGENEAPFFFKIAGSVGKSETARGTLLSLESQKVDDVDFSLSAGDGFSAEVKIDSLTFQEFDFRPFALTFARHLIPLVSLPGDGEAKFQGAMVGLAASESLDNLYPRLGNSVLKGVDMTINGQDVSLEALKISQAPGAGMPDSGSLTLEHLVVSPALLAGSIGPLSQLLAAEDGMIDLSGSFNWSADEAEGAYKVDGVNISLKEGFDFDLAFTLGGLGPNWQSTPLLVAFNPVLLSTSAGMNSLSVEVDDEGLHDKVMAFLPLVTGVSEEEAIGAFDMTLTETLQPLGSETYIEPLKSALLDFAREGGKLSIRVEPKTGKTLPFAVLGERAKRSSKVTGFEDILTYEASHN